MMYILILCLFLLPKGQCDPRKIKAPVKEAQNGEERVYSCKFNVMVDCIWQRNGITSNIHPYKYVDGDGTHTMDCSIKANKREMPLNMECAGLISSPTIVKALEGSTTQLNCSVGKKFSCSWNKNEYVVNVDNNRYRYVGTNDKGHDINDCSIIIINTTAIDVGKWKCNQKIDGDEKSDDALYGFYSLQLESRAVLAEDHTTSTIAPTPTSSTTESPPNLPLSKEAFAAIIVASTLFNGIIVAIILVCRRYKRKQRTTRVTQIETEKGEGHLRRELPQPPSPHQYCNAEEIVLSPLRSTDADGYLVPNNSDKRKISHAKNGHEEMVTTHVYEKILGERL